MTSLKDDLAGPGIERVETHISWVFLSSERVWKVKKPVDLGFLDFSTLDKRRAACEAEVRLNARLAPHVYKGVVPVVQGADGRHRIGGQGSTVDFAVEMVRLSDEVRADTLLAQGRLGLEQLGGLAERIARFHAEMKTDEHIARFGSPDALLGNVRENFAQTRGTIGEHLSERAAREIETKQLGFIETHRDLLEARMLGGRVRDGHGDLRLEHVYLTGDEPVIIDCIEFNERFRYEDVCADVAFLSMDLERMGRVDLAEGFLAAYARACGDYDLYSVVDFYEGYRAYVRGKVASILAHDPDASIATRDRAAEEARRYYVLSLSAGRASLLEPMVVAVGGLIASGKSTVAEQIGTMMSAPVVESDRTRKALLGVTPLEPVHDAPWGGAYAPEMTERVYTEVLRRGERVLASGRPVVLDASFRSRSMRASARELAERHGVPFFFVEARAPRAVCLERLGRRAEAPSVSDGRREIFDDFARRWEPVSELAASQHIVIDTVQPVDETTERLRDQLPTWPPGLTR